MNCFASRVHIGSTSRSGVSWNYVELDQTVGTGASDRHGQPINLLRIANSAVARVYYTERTPQAAVETIKQRLMSANKRYGAQHPTKLVLSERTYEYEEAGE